MMASLTSGWFLIYRYANCWGRLLAGGHCAGQLTMTQVSVYSPELFGIFSFRFFLGEFSRNWLWLHSLWHLLREWKCSCRSVYLQLKDPFPWDRDYIESIAMQAHPGKFSGQIDCLKHIVKEEGLKGIFRWWPLKSFESKPWPYK